MKKIIFLCFALFLAVSAFAQEKKNTFYLAFEKGYYSYREPHMRYPISIKGDKMGASFEWLRSDVIPENVKQIWSSFSAFELRFMSGTPTYDGWLYDPMTEIATPVSSTDKEDYYLEARILFGKKYFLSENISSGLYLGVGYRMLYNNSDMEGAYKRISQYAYVPLGLKLSTDIGTWKLSLNGEFDWFLFGEQRSGLLENDGYVVNKQNQGYGLRGSLRIEKNLTTNFGLFVEPYYRMWKIQNSDETIVSGYDPIEGYWAVSCVEPFNVTKEAGIKVGITF